MELRGDIVYVRRVLFGYAGRLEIPDFVAHDLLAGVASDWTTLWFKIKKNLDYCYRVAGTGVNEALFWVKVILQYGLCD